LSTHGGNFVLWFNWDPSQSLVQSMHRELSNLQEKAAWVGFFRQVPHPLCCQWAGENHT
jgi:hypothetical protein